MNKKNKRIVILDKDDILREFYGRILSDSGFKTVYATHGSEALNTLRNNPDDYGLLIMDLVLENEDGWQVLEEIRRTENIKDIPILTITGISITDDSLKRLNELSNDVIFKGEFEMTRMHDAVENLVAGK